MPFNAMLLPLIGGFIFVSYFRPTSYFAARQTRERLLFYAAAAGIGLLLLGRLGELLASACAPQLIEYIHELAPFRYAFATILAFLLGITLWWPLNKLFPRDWVSRRVINRHGDALELLLVEASDTDSLIMITMDDDKVYVGYVERQPANPNAPDPHLRLVPVVSGYRTKVARKVKFTNYYDDALSALAGQASPFATDGREWSLTDFVKVVPMHRIISAGLFDPAAYEAFQ